MPRRSRFMDATVGLALGAALVGVAPVGAAGAAAATPANGPARPATVACVSWSLARDFRLDPRERNPNPDRCGDRRVWFFLQGGSRPGAFSPLGEFIPDALGVNGLEQWQGPNQSGGPKDKLPAIGINATGTTQVVRNITWPAHEIRMHPWINDHAVVGWRSPVTGEVRFVVRYADLDATCGGDGVAVSVRLGDHWIARKRIPNGGQGHARGTLSVHRGMDLYVIIGNGGRNDFGCDSTGVSIHIGSVG